MPLINRCYSITNTFEFALISGEDNFFNYGTLRTMAEPRPNAYIPDSKGFGELPIAKPYGAHAPFKPQETGSQMRHYRKPAVKPIEI